MTSNPPADAGQVAVIGTGLIGTSVALAARRAGVRVRAWDADAVALARADDTGALDPARDLADAVAGADVAVICVPIDRIASVVAQALAADPHVVVTDAGSVKASVVAAVGRAVAAPGDVARFVPGHPMGGSERSGPEHASAHVIDGIVWALAPTEATAGPSLDRVTGFVRSLGAHPITLTPERHDRLVAVVSHLPQVASTALMALAAREETDEPDLLVLAAGGFRDLTRLAASNPVLWGEILSANGPEVVQAIDLYVAGLLELRDAIGADRRADIERSFAGAKAARVGLAAKPQVRAGVAIVVVEIPDEPGALARITAIMSEAGVNIEDLQIVHSAEGGRGQVQLTVAATTADEATTMLTSAGYDPTRSA